MAMAQEVQLREIGTSGRVCRVLLVEDNLADARLTRELMAEAGGFEVRWASRLAPALESLAREPFDVVLLDLLLPDGIGMEVVERVRAAAPETPVVVLSGLGEDDLALARRAVLRGAQDYLPKSAVDGNLLKRTVSTAIERARLENALRRREAQLEEAQALARMGDWWWRPGDRTISLSAQLMRLIGRDPARFTAGLRGVLRVLEPPARPVLLQAVRRLLEGETSCELRLPVRRPDGGRRIFRVELRRREAGGLYGVCQDVTEQQLVERMKNEFVSVVSHELRTPLTSLLGALRLLRGLHEDGFDPRTRELLDIATRNGDRLKLLVDDLLDLERIESGALAFEPRRVELGGFL
ncbi:MAG TPA: response regulator, partial [Rhodospirillales bacterium]|nr:response regulator [Rhodospirillales bacterium]